MTLTITVNGESRDLPTGAPVAMAQAIRLGVQSGLLARVAGRIPRRRYAEASTPDESLPVFDAPGTAA